jgi:hypothetical protein
MDQNTRFHMMNPLALVSKIFAPNSVEVAKPGAITPVDRRQVYTLLEAYYHNTIYNREIYRGSLDYVNRELGEAAAKDLAGIFNPIERGTEIYAQNVFAGNFGDEIVISDFVGPKNRPRKVNEKIIEPLEQIWDWSNFNSGEKERFPRLGALLGTVGIRVVARVGPEFPRDDPKRRVVYIQFEHPSIIEDYVKNQQQEVTQILTIHHELEGNIDIGDAQTNREVNVYKTLMTEAQFRTLKNDQPYDEVVDQIDGEFASTPNTLGKVPYVLTFHRKLEGAWGAWWFIGSENPIDRLNSLVAHINRQIIRHVKVKWVVTSKGNPPREYNFSDTSVLFIKLSPESNGNDTQIKPLVADLSLADSISEAKFMLGELRDRMPELKATDGDFLSNTTGQTVAQLRIPAIDRLRVARANYESGLIKAQKLALAYGILLGIWDLGTGNNGIQSVQEAIDQRLLDHKFADRDYLTVTQSEQLQNKLLETQIASEKTIAGTGAGSSNVSLGSMGAGGTRQVAGSNTNVQPTP